jgi:Fusaric acid resistance protein-like
LADLLGSIGRSLRPGPSPLAVGAAARAVLAAGIVAGCGVLFGDLHAVAVAYLGAACAVAFVGGGPYRVRAVGLAAQSVGAALGIAAGAALPWSATVVVVTAGLAGAVSGAVGTIGPAAPGFGMMLSIGLAFGQFGGATLPWWQQSAWYLLGTAVVASATLAPWVFARGTFERQAAAAVMDAAAELCAVAGTTEDRAARTRLASASAVARTAGPQPAAELVAFAAATMYADGDPVPADAVVAIRTAAAQLRSGEPVSVCYAPPADSPGLHALADALSPAPQRPAASYGRRLGTALRSAVTRDAVANAARIGICMGVATALTVLLRDPAHSFWLPLTVAVIVRPEYGSVFVRTVNRVCGTLAGALVTALWLLPHPPEAALALGAAAALGFAVLTAPKLYALNVIGVTASALLSSSLAGVDPVLPGLRLLDTALGAVVAVVFGYLLWPTARRLPGVARLDAALDAARSYLDEAAKPPDERARWQVRRDDAYRLAHQARAGAQAAAVEPPPVSAMAIKVIPAAAELEDLVDAITAVAAATDLGEPDLERVAVIERRLLTLESVGRP